MNFSEFQENIKSMLPTFYKKVETEEGELLLPASPSEIDLFQRLTVTPRPAVRPILPQTLTHQLYLDIRRKDKETTGHHYFNYLSFTNKSYVQHFKTTLYRSWVCTKSSFFFFIQSFYPDAFQHYGTDLVVELGENILDEYSTAINNRADNCV
jgi:hypothetical protein